MRTLRVSMIIALFIAPGIAAAQTVQDKAAADVLFQEGRTLVKAGKFAEACPKFEASFKLDPKGGTRLNLADCYEKTGRTASAWALFREAASLARKAGESEREDFAMGRAATLEPKLARIVVTVSKGGELPGLEIKNDGQPVSLALLGTPFPIDPGSHVIEAVATGRTSWASKVSVEPGAKITVEVPVLGEATRYPETPKNGAPVASQAAPEAQHDEPPDPGATRKYIAYGLGGAGVVAIGVGVGVFGSKAKSKKDEAYKMGAGIPHCNSANVCDPKGVDLVDQAKKAALLSTIMTGVGVAAVAGGVVLYLTAPKRESTAVSVAPVFDGEAVTIAVSGGF